MDSELMRITNHDDDGDYKDNHDDDDDYKDNHDDDVDYKDNHGGVDEHIYDDNDVNDGSTFDSGESDHKYLARLLVLLH